MLNQSNYNILNKKNTETFEGTTIPVRHFGNNNKDKIIQKLFVEEKNNPEYETARQTILDYFKKNYFEFINDLLELREIKLSKPTTQFSISTLNSDTNTDDSLDRKEKNSYYINEISLSGYDNDDIDGKIHSLFCDNLLSELVKLMNFKEDCEMKYEHASIYHYLKELFIKIEETLEKEEYHNLDLTKYYEYFKFSEENNVSKKVKSLKNKYITFFQRLQEDLKNDKIPFEIKLSLINQCLEQMEQDLSDLNKEISRHIRNSLRHVRYDENSNGTIRLQDKEEGSAEIKFECEMEICEVKTMADTCFEYLEKGNNLNFIQRLIKCINQIKVLFGEDEEFSKYLTNIGFYLICVIEKIKEENEEDEAKLS